MSSKPSLFISTTIGAEYDFTEISLLFESTTFIGLLTENLSSSSFPVNKYNLPSDDPDNISFIPSLLKSSIHG